MDVDTGVLQDVLFEARKKHTYVTDAEQYGKTEHWEAGLVGDCEDFAMWCRDRLKELGIASDLAMCLVETGDGHLVCHVDGYILDNRYRWVMKQSDLPYTWLKLGKPDGTWYEIKQD